MPVIRDLAKAHLRPYVERGDTADDICKACPASGDERNRLQIGGTVHVKGQLRQVGGGQLAVTLFEGEEYYTTFSVAQLCQEIQQELDERDTPKQLGFW